MMNPHSIRYIGFYTPRGLWVLSRIYSVAEDFLKCPTNRIKMFDMRIHFPKSRITHYKPVIRIVHLESFAQGFGDIVHRPVRALPRP